MTPQLEVPSLLQAQPYHHDWVNSLDSVNHDLAGVINSPNSKKSDLSCEVSILVFLIAIFTCYDQYCTSLSRVEITTIDDRIV